MKILITKNKKLENLIDYLKSLKNVVIAFSGGVDSTFLLYISLYLAKINIKAVTFLSELISEDEIQFINNFVKEYNINHKYIKNEILHLDIFKKNPINRCYLCKKEIFTKIIDYKNSINFDYIIEGTNFDDKNQYRPGKQALLELNIKSPLLEFNLTKKEIRYFSKKFNLITYNKPSIPCFATRFPYNEEITLKKIEIVKNSEKYIKELLNIDNLRVRLHKDILRIEILPKHFNKIIKFKNSIISFLKNYNIYYITLDLEGLISGSLDKVILRKKNE